MNPVGILAGKFNDLKNNHAAFIVLFTLLQFFFNFGANTTMSVGALKNESVYLDIVNLDRYDVVIGTPFMHDYGVVLDFEKGAIRINGAWVPALKGGEGEPVVKKSNGRLPVRKMVVRKRSTDVPRRPIKTPDQSPQ